jgi:ABC-2 type transport system permease protein
VLAAGMLAAALVGVPAVATSIALIGLAVGGAVHAGLGGAVVGVLGAVLGLLLCVVLSRALTSALSQMLRSRRVRDLTAVLIALLSASIGPLNLLINSTASHANLAPVLRVVRILDWTPFAAGFVTPYDIASGHPLRAVARLAIVALTVVLLLWWWSRTLETAMLGGTSSGSRGSAVAMRGGAVEALLPRLVRLGRPGPFVAIVGREMRYWSRDPRRRAGLISIVIGGAVVPIAFTLVGGRHHNAGLPLSISLAFSCAVGAAILANQFGFDGTAYATHLLAGVPGRTDLRARATALALILGPALLVVAVVVGIAAHRGAELLPAIGTMAATFGGSLASSSILSVHTAYPVPESQNPLAVNSGSGSAKGVLALVGMIGAVVAASPVVIGALLLPGSWALLVVPVGVAWGVGAVLLSTYIAGDSLDRRGPELLAAVTPGR